MRQAVSQTRQRLIQLRAIANAPVPRRAGALRSDGRGAGVRARCRWRANRTHTDAGDCGRSAGVSPRRLRYAWAPFDLRAQIPFAFSAIRQYWIRVMFDVIKAQLAAAGEKLAHLRRFL